MIYSMPYRRLRLLMGCSEDARTQWAVGHVLKLQKCCRLISLVFSTPAVMVIE